MINENAPHWQVYGEAQRSIALQKFSDEIALGAYAITDSVARAKARNFRAYQAAIIRGCEAISGATLQGKASHYSGRYKRSAYSAVSKVGGNTRLLAGRRVVVAGLICELALDLGFLTAVRGSSWRCDW